MSLRYLTVCTAVAALLAAPIGPSSAKPPDLPFSLQVTCQPQAEGPADGAEAPAAPDSCPYSCPYLRQQEMDRQHPRVEPPEPASTLENLEKLEQAEKLLRAAERHQQANEPDLARDCYEGMRRLCPGSRYDRMGTARLRQLKAQAAARTVSKAGAAPDEAAELAHALLEGFLHSGTCFEIDTSRLGGLRARCGITLGGLTIRVVAGDETVGQYCVVSFLPSPLAELVTPTLAHAEADSGRKRPATSGEVEEQRQGAGASGCEMERER